MTKSLTIGLVVPFSTDRVPEEGPMMYPGVTFIPRAVGVRALTPEGYDAAWDGIMPAAKQLAQPDAAHAAIADEHEWIRESFELAQGEVYRAPVGAGTGPFALTAKYRSDAHALAAKRVALAGARLANLLNNELR